MLSFMRTQMFILVLFCSFFVQGQEANVIFKKAIDQLLTHNVELSIEIKEVDKKGRVKEKSFTIKMAQFGPIEKTRMEIQKPERAKGVTIVITKSPKETGLIEVFTPANGKIRKMKATPKNLALVGSTISLSNYTSKKMEDLLFKSIGKEQLNGKLHYVIEVKERLAKEAGKAKFWIETESYRILQLVTYTKNGVEENTTRFSSFDTVKGVKKKIYPKYIITTNTKDDSVIEVKVLNIISRPEITEDDFSLQ